MPKRLWTIKASNSAGWEIDFSAVYSTNPPRQELVRGLLAPAQTRNDAEVPTRPRGANPEQRLAELGFIVTSLTDVEAPSDIEIYK